MVSGAASGFRFRLSRLVPGSLVFRAGPRVHWRASFLGNKAAKGCGCFGFGTRKNCPKHLGLTCAFGLGFDWSLKASG